MEKLELKEIVGYLPYGLKIETHGIITKLFSINPDYGTVKFIDKDKEPYNTSLEHIKPILHPLSDLTKEIEVDGVKFVPIDWFEKNIHKSITFYSNIGGKLDIDIETGDYAQTVDLFDGYLVIQKLYEWHFDIHNLINRGLAIDINTL